MGGERGWREGGNRRFGGGDNLMRKIDIVAVVMDCVWILSWLMNPPTFFYEWDQLLDREL